MHWSYAACRDLLQTAGASIDVALAERRNLLLRNPVEGNSFWTSNTLLAAYQMILPGEFARPHRHAPHALRVIIEGEGAYSIVDGEKMPMQPGDVVLTPGGSWHSHGHAGESPAFWLDGLDSPLVRQLEVMSYEEPA
jgi:gentisate 1,2-dioxygenase